MKLPASLIFTGDGIRTGESGKTWKGYNPTQRGRNWAIPGYVYEMVEDDISDMGVLDKLDYLFQHNFIELSVKERDSHKSNVGQLSVKATPSNTCGPTSHTLRLSTTNQPRPLIRT